MLKGGTEMNSMKRRYSGLTLVELMAAVWAIILLVFAAGVVWVAIHFISKFW